MDQHIPASTVALVVDGYSTGKLYPAASRTEATSWDAASERLLLRLAGLRLKQAYGEGLTVLDERSRRMLLVALRPGPGKLQWGAGQ